MRPCCIVAIVLVCLIGQRSPAAQSGCAGVEVAVAAGNYDQALKLGRRCLGDPAVDDDILVTDFDSRTPDAPTAEKRLEAVVSALEALRDFATLRVIANTDVAVWAAVAAQLQAELRTAGDVQLAVEERFNAIDERFWAVPATADPLVLGGMIRLFQPLGCATPPAFCATYESRVELLRVLRLMSRLIGFVHHPALAQHFAQARLMNDRWEGYFNEALPQYWWEVAINGARMGDDICPKEPDTGIQLGFCRVPESQLIVLHPSAALQWVRGPEDQDDLAVALVVEMFGRNSWRWKDDDATLHGQFGWSLIAAYSDPGGDRNNWSYGVMMHKGGSLNVGVTTAGAGEISIVVSVKLAEKMFARKARYLDYLKAVRKPSWKALLQGR